MKYKVQASLSLLEALEKLFPDSSKTTLRSWIKEERVRVDDIVIKNASIKLLPGQEVTLDSKKRLISGGIQILFQDNHLVVIDKPSGLLSVATASEMEMTAHSFLQEKFGKKVYVVHRLDKDTSGLMMFALSEEAFNKLQAMFEKHLVERCYMAVVEGKFSKLSGSWESYLYEDEQYLVHSSQDSKRGVFAKTHYEVKRVSNKFSLVEFKLETGKKNQIRVHCQSNHHSIVGDKKYGACTDPLNRLCLHAYLLLFQHPITGKDLTFESSPPKEFFSIC